MIFQAIFLAVIYREIVHIQQQLLDQQKQEALARQKQLLIKENEQLKEYAAYLDKNEDELRRFKHDYQNILLSLKLSAEKGGSQALVEELEKYTISFSHDYNAVVLFELKERRLEEENVLRRFIIKNIFEEMCREFGIHPHSANFSLDIW